MWGKLFHREQPAGGMGARPALAQASLNAASLPLYIREVARGLVEACYPKETGAFELVADDFIAAAGRGETLRPADVQVSGLPMGNLGDLGTIQVLAFAALVFQLVYERYKDRNLSTPALARLLRNKAEAEPIIEVVRQQQGLDPKTARAYWEKTVDILGPAYHFVYGECVDFEEDRSIEFKNVKAKNLPAEVLEFAVAYLNGEGGRLLQGIVDETGAVVGMELPTRKKVDELKQNIMNVFYNQVKPGISPGAVEVLPHSVYREGNEMPGRYVIEIVVPKPAVNTLYATNKGIVYMKTDTGRRELTADEISDEKKRRGL